MPGFIPEEKIAEIQRSIDIVELISSYIPLKRAGTRYKALCPFHHEKTPSFFVSPDRQFFKCFGCNEGGDVFKFVMKMERVDFPEAVRILAQRTSVKLTYSGDPSAPEQKAPLYEANAWAAGVFARNLREAPEASYAREYLAKRRISKGMVEKFQLGYASPIFNSFSEAAKQANLCLAVLERAGLLRRRAPEDEPTLQFRNRLMFPIRDSRQRVVAFGARALREEDQPKYLNSPETAVFSKSRTLYGIAEARDSILKHRRVAIVEGYTDVIMAHQFGIDWVVAVLGTALTEEHLRELRRYADEVVLVFDADSAGQKSSDRSLDIFIEEEIPVRIATLPEGEDPCDFLLNHGADAFLAILNKADDLITFKMDRALAGLADAAPWQWARALDDVLQTVARTPNPVTLDLLLKHVSERARVDERALRDRLARLRSRREEAPALESGGDATRSMAIGKAQCEVIQSLLRDNTLMDDLDTKDFLSHFVDASYRTVGEKVLQTFTEQGRVTEQDVLARLSDLEAREAMMQVMGLPEPGSGPHAQFVGALQFLKKVKTDEEAARLKSKILTSDPSQVSDALLKEFQEKARRTRARAFPKGLTQR